MERIANVLIRLMMALIVSIGIFSEKPALASETLRIGVHAALSGPGVGWGLPYYQTVKTQAELYNKEGGVKIGDKIYNIELIVEDDKYMAESGVAAVNKLIFRDKVDYILGGLSTLITVAAGPIYQKNKVLAIVNGTSGPGLSPELTWVFRICNTEYERGVGIGRWLSKSKREISKVAFIAPDTEGGHGSIKTFDDIIKSFTKWEMVGGEYYEIGQKEYYPILKKILGKKPDLLYYDTAPIGDAGLLTKQSREIGFKGVIWYNTISDPAIMLKIAGSKACEDLYQPNYACDITPEMKRLCDAYYERYHEFNAAITLSCDFFPVLIQAMQQAGSIDKNKVRDALEKGVFKSHAGPDARFYGKERYGIAHQWLAPVSVSRIRDGKSEVVETISVNELLQTMGIKK